MIDRDVFRKRPDAQVTGTSVNLVAYRIVAHFGTDTRHDAGEIVPEHEWCLVLKEQLELAIAHHLVQRVDASGSHPDQNVTGPDGGREHLGGAEPAFAIFLDDESLHVRSNAKFCSRVGRVHGFSYGKVSA